MSTTRKLLLTGGLVLMTSPLCFQAFAQDQGYVDVEAEEAARKAAGAAQTPSNPYGVKPPQSYPATSYGVGPATPAGAPPTATGSAGSGQGSSGNYGNLVLQIQQLQQEMMRLNGKVEEQAHELRRLKEQSLQRYMDLDKRVGGESAAGGPAAAGAAAGSAAATSQPTPSGNSNAPAQAGEKAAYDAAYALVVGRQFSQAIPAFQQFLRDFPGGRYAPNAHYWLGELYLVAEPPDLESSRQSFALLISQYPDHSKAADSLYKLGKVQFMKGNREKAREYLDLVIAQYGSTNSSVARLAEDFIAENY